MKECMDNVRKNVPLVHNITNYVTVNDVANILLACGGSPIMSDEPEDVEDITSVCGGLNINIGTLHQSSICLLYTSIVLLSTHIVSDIEYIADEILVMKQGKLIRCGKPQTLLKDLEGKVWECLVPFEAVAEMERHFTVGNLKNEEQGCLLRIVSDICPVKGAKEAQPSLEDIYLYDFQREEDKR